LYKVGSFLSLIIGAQINHSGAAPAARRPTGGGVQIGSRSVFRSQSAMAPWKPPLSPCGDRTSA
jgi:hypothetical protein